MATNDTQKPGLPVFLQGLLDLGTGLITRKADLESGRLELQIANANKQAEAERTEQALARQQALASTGSGFDQKTLLVAGAAIVGVLIIARL